MSEDSLEKFNEDVMQAKEHHKIISNNLKLQKTTDESLYFTYYLFPLKSNYALILADNTSIYNKNIMFNNIIKAMEAYHSQFSSSVESSSVEEVFKRTTNIELKEMKVENPRMFRNIKRAMEKYHEQFTPLEN